MLLFLVSNPVLTLSHPHPPKAKQGGSRAARPFTPLGYVVMYRRTLVSWDRVRADCPAAWWRRIYWLQRAHSALSAAGSVALWLAAWTIYVGFRGSDWVCGFAPRKLGRASLQRAGGLPPPNPCRGARLSVRLTELCCSGSLFLKPADVCPNARQPFFNSLVLLPDLTVAVLLVFSFPSSHIDSSHLIYGEVFFPFSTAPALRENPGRRII